MNNFQNENVHDERKIHITDLDTSQESERPFVTHILRKFSPLSKNRALMIAFTLVISMLLVLLTFWSTIFTVSKVPQSRHMTTTSGYHDLVDMSVTQGAVYINAPDGTVNALRTSDGSLLWRYSATVPGHAMAHLVVVQNIMYLISQNGSGDAVVEALHGRNGSHIWSFTQPSLSILDMEVEDGIVYAYSSNAVLYALRATDGVLLWQRLVGISDLLSSFLVVEHGVAYINFQNHTLRAIQERNGSLLWSFHDTTGERVSKIILVKNDVTYINGEDGSVIALRASTGTLLWHYLPNVKERSWFAAIGDGRVYVYSQGNTIKALRTSDGSVLWNYHAGGEVAEPPQADGEVVYVQSQSTTVSALRASNGSLLWQYKSSSSSSLVWPPMIVDGNMYINSQTVGKPGSVLYALQVSDGFELWHHTTNRPNPVLLGTISGDKVYISTNNNTIDAVRVNDGSLVWHHQLSLPGAWYLIVADKIAYIAMQDGTVDVVHTNDGSLIWHFPRNGY